jgi:8-amino-7-oxononanoate synthase
MTSFENELAGQLHSIREQGLYRELRTFESPQAARLQLDGATFLNFSSNDYLGLANAPEIKSAAIEAIQRYGAGAGASRLISGSLVPHRRLEEAIPEFKDVEAALSFSTGYAAAMGAIGALAGKQDVIVLDKLAHACLIDAARLSGAKLRVFTHNDLDSLESILQWTQRRAADLSFGTKKFNVLIVTESVFSMDGDHAPLLELVELKEKYGAWLMLDEAHATGLYGPNRRGLAEECGVGNQIEVQMGTLGKALGAAGGYICGSRKLVDLLINRARSFVFSTAPVPAAAAAATEAIRIVRSSEGEERRARLWKRVDEFAAALGHQGALSSAIIPILIGDENKAMETAAALRDRRVFIPAVRYPTVARGRARLRVTLTAGHTREDVAELSRIFRELDLRP